jgi:type I restriction enzyme S subunit
MSAKVRTVLLEEIAAEQKNAMVGGPFGSNLVSKDYVDKGVPVIRGQNMGGRWVSGEFAYVTPQKADSLSANTARPGDLVFTQRGTLGQVSIVPNGEYDRYIVSQSQMKITVNPALADVSFLYYVFTSPAQLTYIKINAIQVGVPHTNLGILRKTPVQLPDLLTQQRIAAVLRSLDDKIQLNNQINQTLEQMAQAIFKSWFVGFEPVKAKIAVLEAGGSAADAELAAMQAISGKKSDQLEQMANEQPEKYGELCATAELFPSAMQESELGEIPEGWEVSQIGDEVTVVGGGTPSTKIPEYWRDGDIHWTTPRDLSNLNDKILTDTERKITSAGLAKISSGLLPIDTVLMSSRAPVGYLALAKVPVAVNQGYIAMKCEKQLSSEYVLQWCESRMEEIKNRASGTTFAEISKKNFNAIPVVVPHQSLILAYTKQAKSIYKKIEMLAKESRDLADLRDTLLPQLLSGSITVKNMEA